MQAPLKAPETSLGFDGRNDIKIDDPGVSGRHALLRLVGNTWYAYDLGSRNGTFVNKKRVGAEGEPVTPADTIKIGRSRLKIRMRAPAQFETVQDIPVPKLPTPKAPVQPARNVEEIPVPFRPQPPQEPPRKDIEPPRKQPPPVAQRPPVEAQKREPARKSEAPPKSLDAGIVLDGRYELLEVIDRGTTGTVYRARRILLGDFVAVKLLNQDIGKDPMALERFRRQARVAARIHHPNSVQVYDVGSTPEGRAFIVEELLSGRTLRDLLNEERGLTLQRIVGIFNQICGAVHTAHVNGIVLRSLKPESIYVERAPDGSEVIKVGGYGVAKIEGASNVQMTMAGQAKMLGRPEYQPPEMFLEKPLDSRSDVYSLGVILFELLTNEVPFDSDDPFEIAQMHLSAPVPDITKFARRDDIDEGLAVVVSRALSKDPALRQPTALNLAAELQAVSDASGGIFRRMLTRVAVLPAQPKVIVQGAAAPAMEGEVALPSVVAEGKTKGKGALNPTVVALMTEAFLSRMSGGLVKTAVPLYALLVFGLPIAETMLLVLIQNVVPLLLRPFFGTLADRYGKKKVFMISLTLKTAVSVLYAVATLPMLFAISVVRGMADSAKGPSASAMIADNTDERHIAQAYSWYTTIKSTSGGIGEGLAAFLLLWLLVLMIGTQTVTANVAVLEGLTAQGTNKEEFITSPEDVAPDGTIAGTPADPNPQVVLGVEQREVRLGSVPIEDLPKVIDSQILRRALVVIFIVSAAFSALSLILVQFFIREKKKEKSAKKKDKPGSASLHRRAGMDTAPAQQPNVWSFALMGALLTAPAYMVTGEFFTILAVKLNVTSDALGWIKIVAETLVPLFFGPIFGWLADRFGAGKIIALRSVSNMATSLLFWITPWFAGTAMLAVMMGIARGVDEIGKAAFKPTWGAVAAKVSSFNLANRSRTMGIMEGGVDASDLTFPVVAALLFQYLSLGVLMAIRAALALIAEIYVFFLMKKYRI
ncbi:MAG TPA: MFS transporter [Blastocatellia bacterium]